MSDSSKKRSLESDTDEPSNDTTPPPNAKRARFSLLGSFTGDWFRTSTPAGATVPAEDIATAPTPIESIPPPPVQSPQIPPKEQNAQMWMPISTARIHTAIPSGSKFSLENTAAMRRNTAEEPALSLSAPFALGTHQASRQRRPLSSYPALSDHPSNADRNAQIAKAALLEAFKSTDFRLYPPTEHTEDGAFVRIPTSKSKPVVIRPERVYGSNQSGSRLFKPLMRSGNVIPLEVRSENVIARRKDAAKMIFEAQSDSKPSPALADDLSYELDRTADSDRSSPTLEELISSLPDAELGDNFLLLSDNPIELVHDEDTIVIENVNRILVQEPEPSESQAAPTEPSEPGPGLSEQSESEPSVSTAPEPSLPLSLWEKGFGCIPEGGWRCPTCDLPHDAKIKKCTCGTLSPNEGSEARGIPEGGWKCPTCSVPNLASVQKCTSCGALSPNGGSEARDPTTVSSAQSTTALIPSSTLAQTSALAAPSSRFSFSAPITTLSVETSQVPMASAPSIAFQTTPISGTSVNGPIPTFQFVSTAAENRLHFGVPAAAPAAGPSITAPSIFGSSVPKVGSATPASAPSNVSHSAGTDSGNGGVTSIFGAQSGSGTASATSGFFFGAVPSFSKDSLGSSQVPSLPSNKLTSEAVDKLAVVSSANTESVARSTFGDSKAAPTGTFSFGSTTAPVAPPTGLFSFGSTTAPVAPPTGLFSFGSTTAPLAPPTGSFSFGSTSAPPVAPPTGLFSFGSTSAPPVASPAGSFSFGSTSAPPVATPSFMFGNSLNAPTTQATNGFGAGTGFTTSSNFSASLLSAPTAAPASSNPFNGIVSDSGGFSMGSSDSGGNAKRRILKAKRPSSGR